MILISNGETEICKFITSELKSSYACYWYDDLNRAFFGGRGYQCTIDTVGKNKIAHTVLSSLLILIRDAPKYGMITIRDILGACYALSIPPMHILYFCDDYKNNEYFQQFTNMAIYGILNLKVVASKPDPNVLEFNILKAQYQGNSQLQSHNATIFYALKQCRDKKFTTTQNRILFTLFDEVSTYMRIMLECQLMTSFRSHIKITRSYEHYTMGYVESTHSSSKCMLGNFAAVYNVYMIKMGKESMCLDLGEYTVDKVKPKQTPRVNNVFKQMNDVELAIRRIVKGTKNKICFDNDEGGKPLFTKPNYTYAKYKEKVKKHLDINFDLDNKAERVFSIYTGIVLHANLLIVGDIKKEKIIYKPLARFISTHKTMTCSYYKEIKKERFNWVKFNLNCQGEEFFIRCKLLTVHDKIKNECDFANSKAKLFISNQCGYIHGLHVGVMNVHHYRTKLLKEVNCFKIQSFPAIEVVDEVQTTKSRDNIIHRETVLTRIHKTHSMIDNMKFLKKHIFPHCERIDDLQEIVYNVESYLRLILNGPLMGILKMMYLHEYDIDGQGGDNDKKLKSNLVNIFTKYLWIDRYIIAQNDKKTLAPMCYRFKECAAIKSTSIKTRKNRFIDPPPVVDDRELLTTIASLFDDTAVGILTPRLWKGRGAFSFLDVLILAPTKTVYGKTGKRLVVDLYKLLKKHGGKKLFPDCYKLLRAYKLTLFPNKCNKKKSVKPTEEEEEKIIKEKKELPEKENKIKKSIKEKRIKDKENRIKDKKEKKVKERKERKKRDKRDVNA